MLGILILAWIVLTVGFTYLVREAKIADIPRLLIIRRFPGLINLLSCGPCTSFWTSLAVAGLLLPILLQTYTIPWWGWFYAPLMGIFGIGMFDILTRLSFAKPLDRIAKTIREMRENGLDR